LNDHETVSSPRVFILVVALIIIVLSGSLLLAINALFASQLLERLILIAGFLVLFTLTFILLWGYSKKELSGTPLGPMCKNLLSEYRVCARCIGFYVGGGLFGLLFTGDSHIFIALLDTIMLAPYLLVLVLTALSVPIHGGLRRLNVIKADGLLHITGFAFSLSPFLFASLILYLIHS